MIVPYAPGGLTDVVARYFAEQMRKSLGQAVYVENKPGASGILAIEEMARAKPDGYTIMIGNISTNGLTPVLLTKKMKIDYEKDVQIIARLADVPVFFLATTMNFAPKTFAEFLRVRKGQPRQGALRQRRRRQLSTDQHRNSRQSAPASNSSTFRSRTAAREFSATSPTAIFTSRGSTSPTRSA